MQRLGFGAMAAGVMLCGAATAVQANVASGRLWHVSEATSQNAVPANVPATTPDVTFNVSTPFNFSASDATVGQWLASSGAFDVHENTAGTLSSLMDDRTLGTFVEFDGLVTVTNGQTFKVAHDDGLTLIVGGLDLGFNPGPTAPTITTITYNGPSGTFPFQLVYGECCGGPAVLQVDLPFSTPSAVPLPGAAWMGMALIGGIGLVKRARRIVKAE